MKEFNDKWTNSRVLVIGDVMLDKWSYHLQTRISPEAPVPVIREESIQFELGGAGNALRHLNYLSTNSHELLTILGNDQTGLQLREISNASKSIVHWVMDTSRITTVKERLFIDGRLIFRKDSEDLSDISANLEAEIVQSIKSIVHNFNVILISDYAKGIFTVNLVKQIQDLAIQYDIPIVTDPGYGRVHIYAGCTVVKPNLSEWNEYVKLVGSEAKGIEFLFAEGTQSILVTQGSQGVRLITPTEDVIELPKEGIEVIDVTGAGDSLAAAISLVIGEGHSLSDNLENLNLIGANTVRHAKTELPGFS